MTFSNTLSFVRLCVRAVIFSIVALAALASASQACSVCGCSLSADWASQDYGIMPGLQAGLRFEYFDQDNLRSGTCSVSRASVIFPNGREIQQDTLNRNTWLDLDYVESRHWGLTLQIPFHDRFHSTIAPGDTELSTSRASGLGDARIMGRYQAFGAASGFSFQLGLKLPTGRFDQNFATGPAAGTPLDRGLQLGTGTTDLLAGVSYFARPAPMIGGFAQVVLDQPLAYRAGFIPSASAGANVGIRYLNTTWLTPQAQLNLRCDGRERGANSDFDNSGGTMVYLSPGLTAEVGDKSSAFAFVQIPLYQRLNGLQLEPRWLLSLGLRRKF